jgi:peptide/nickel transport system permease protein
MSREAVHTLPETTTVKGRSLWDYALLRFRQNRGAMTGLVVVILIILAALAAPLITSYDYAEQDLLAGLLPPSAEHPFGTDQFGRDLYTRVVYGARISLRIGLVSVGIAVVLGIPLGLLSGYYAGWVDITVMRVVDLLLAFPAVLLAMAIMTVLGPSLTNAMIAVGISIVPQFVRIARGATLSAKEMDYVVAAKTIGCQDRHIMVRHILPNVILPLIVLTTLQIAAAILFASGLSFLGLGAKPPSPEWGAMLTEGRVYMREAWWIPVFPGLAITFTILAMNLVGDGLRDALDPQLTIE